MDNMRFPHLSIASRSSSIAALAAAGLVVCAAASAQQPAPAPETSPSGYHLEATWKIGGEGGWDYLSFDPAAHRLYVARQDRVQVIDADKGTLAGEVTGLDGAHGIALVPELGRGFASSGKSDSVVIFDLKTLAAIGEPVHAGEKPDAIIYDPASKQVFAFNGKSENATAIDAQSGKVVATIALGGKPEFAAADGRGMVYVNLEDKSEIAAIRTADHTVAQRWPIAPGEEATGLSMDPAGRHLFAGCSNQKLVVLDAENGKVLAALPIGEGVDATAFDPGTGWAFSSNGDGTLTVVQAGAAGKFRVLDTVKTQPSARTMALDPRTHAIYLAAATFATGPAPASTAPHQRPPMVPGSFVVLKFVR
jgi:DNA-binding beta-propeller fold protein YncE